MEFGKIHDLEEIDFSLPPDDPMNEMLWQRLATRRRQNVRLYVGCTQWGRTDWVGKVYPRGAKQKDFLSHYVKQFNCIELNTLFYSLQPRSVIERWASLAGEGFRFCPKISESISHKLQLQNARQETALFVDHVLAFGDKAGPSFLQLSEGFGPDRATVLQEYVSGLPRGFPVCVELRQKDWFGRGIPAAARDTWTAFQELGVGTVITDTAGRRDVLHMRLTAPVVFIRWAGNDKHPTNFARIDAWAQRIKTWIERGLEEIYFIIHNPDELYAPDLALYAVQQFNANCGTTLKPPKLIVEPPPLTLF